MAGIVIGVTGFVITQVHNQLSARKGANSARSIGVYLKNLTDETLILKSASLAHGIWTASGPVPQKIGPQEVGAFMCESNGVLTGCEGQTTWSFESDAADAGGNRPAKFTIHFDNPYVGSNKYSEELAAGVHGFHVAHTGGGGDNADVVFT